MKKTILVLAIAALAVAATLLTGCEIPTHETGAYVPVNTTINDVENHELIVLLDRRVQYSVTCSGIQQRTLPDGRLEINVNIRNREGRRIQVQANCVFKDAQGFPTEGEDAPFRNLILSENAQESLQFVSFNNKAQHYTIRVRQAH